MKQKEKDLFKSLCSFKEDKFDETLLDYASPAVLGQLFFNRMQGVAYGMLKNHNLLGKVNREFRNSLKAAYNENIKKNNSYFLCLQQLHELLSNCGCNYAMLKGAYLCKFYPEGYRTSNDIDLLVHPKDVTKIGNVLIDIGFKQGNVRNGKFVPATRKEIIESKMTRGETVPYIKEIDLPGMQFLEIDINFSLDYKPGDSKFLEEMLNNTEIVEIRDLKVRTLRTDDFFVHLCNHLYKETATLPWIEMMRDMTLYKYCDIYVLLNDADKVHIDCLFKRAQELGMEKICAFAILHMTELFKFKNLYAVETALKALLYDLDFLHMVVSPKDGKEFVYKERNIFERFFLDDRKELLEEVKNIENFKYEA